MGIDSVNKMKVAYIPVCLFIFIYFTFVTTATASPRVILNLLGDEFQQLSLEKRAMYKLIC